MGRELEIVMRRVLLIFLLTLTLLAGASTFTTRGQQPDPGNPNIVVWVDTAYGFYHCPGTKWYGNTPQGVYMKQGQAQARGYRPAYGTVCR